MKTVDFPTPKTAKRLTDDRDRALYVISVAAELADVHPQTLRMYERKGLISPQRTAGNNRRYSQRDIERVRLIQSMTQEHGMNLAAVEVVISLQRELDEAKRRLDQLEDEVDRARREQERAASSGGALVLRRDIQDLFGAG
ncbi:MAG TPA: helix-turn-helix transcriptional regulator [Actinomycetota bacterium]|nr:helix-turn-helix transcriptional regulator [Actinomycetota bacterium]